MQFFDKLNISKKLMFANLTGMFLLLCCVGYTFYTQTVVSNQYRHFLEKETVAREQVMTIQVEFKTMVQEWKNLLVRTYDDKDKGKYWQKFLKSEQQVLEHSKLSLEQLQQLDNDAATQMSAFIKSMQVMGQKYREGHDYHQRSGMDAAGTDKVVRGIDREPLERLQALVAHMNERQQKSLEAQYRSVERQEQIEVAILLVAFTLAIFFGIAVIRRFVVQPMNQVTNSLRLMAEGDFSHSIRLSQQDEFGQLARDAEHLRERQVAVLNQLSQMSGDLNHQSSTMQKEMGETTLGIEEQYSLSDHMASAMTEMVASVAQVSASAQLAADNVTQTNEHLNLSKKNLNDTKQNILSLQGAVSQSGEVMGRLERESQEIGAILDVIRNIAEQTNLLALNAAIEAARAGDQGRGFAVVADEVRSLASRTQESTQQIQTMIERLQHESKEAVEAIQNGQRYADLCVTQSVEVDEMLGQVTQEVDQLNGMSMEIASAAAEQARVSEDISQNVLRVKELGDVVKSNADTVGQVGESIGHQANELNQVVSEYRLS